MCEVDKNSKTPLYVQLMNILIYKIENYMEEHDRLESEREICGKYGVSRPTVRQALDELEKAKYIYKVQGKGNFIAGRRLEQNLVRVYSFSDEMKKLGKKPTSKLINFEIIEAQSKIARKLKILQNELIYKVTRVRIADDVPMIYEISYLPYERFIGMTKEMLKEGSLYEIFKNNFNLNITSAEEVLETALINKLESIYLSVPEGNPGLRIERTTYENKKIIEYTLTIARGDKFKYRVLLNNE